MCRAVLQSCKERNHRLYEQNQRLKDIVEAVAREVSAIIIFLMLGPSVLFYFSWTRMLNTSLLDPRPLLLLLDPIIIGLSSFFSQRNFLNNLFVIRIYKIMPGIVAQGQLLLRELKELQKERREVDYPRARTTTRPQPFSEPTQGQQSLSRP